MGRGAIGVCILLSACAAAPPGTAAPTADGAFLAARYADSQAQPVIATRYYGAALAADPDNASLTSEAFVAAVLAGSPRAAVLAARLQGSPLAAMLLGNQAARGGDFAKAQAEFASLPDDGLSALLKPLLVAWAEAGAGSRTEALRGLGALSGNDPYGPVYLLNAAMIADLFHDPDEAGQLYAQAANGQAINLRLAQIIASWQARHGQAVAAAAEIDAVGTAHPDLAIAVPALQTHIADPAVGTATDGLAEAYLTVAGSLPQPSQSLLRSIFLQFALTLRPDLTAARLLLADMQTETQTGSQTGSQAGSQTAGQPGGAAPADAQLQTALATLRPVGTNDPLYAPAALQEASLLAALNQTDAAVTLLDQLAALTPGDGEPAQAAGDILRAANRNAEAISEYDKAITAAGQPPPFDAWSLYFDRAICEDQAGDWAAAEPDLMNALALAPNQPYLLNYIGYSWALRGEKLQQAQTMLSQAAGLDPNDGAVIDSLGYVSLRQGHTTDALHLLTQAVELDPNDAEVNAHLGDAFYAAGLRLQADYQWQRALSLKPDAKLQADIAGHLKQLQPPA